MAGFTLSSARLSVTTGSLPVLSLAPSSAPYTIRSASERLPFRSTLLTSAVTSGEPYTGSVTSCRRVAGPLRGMSALLLLRSVAAARLLTAAHPLGVEGAADDLVADPGQVAHPAAAHQHDRVLLQVVPDAGDVRGDLDLAGEPDPRHLAQCGVRLLGRGRVDARADAPALRAALQGRGRGLGYLVLAALSDQLLDGGHRVSVFFRASLMPVTCWFLSLSDPRGRACRARHGIPAPAEAGCQKGVGLRAWPLAAPGLAAGESPPAKRACARVP